MKNLDSVIVELFDMLESTTLRNGNPLQERQRLVEDYFRKRSIEDEISGKVVKDYPELCDLVKRDVLPVYESYNEYKTGILQKQGKRSIMKYIGLTVLACNLVEAIVSRGASLRPQVLASTLLFEAPLGYSIYWITQKRDDRKLAKAKKNFFRSMKNIDSLMQMEKRFDAYQDIMDGELLRTEANSLLAQYREPEHFWADYRNLRRMDPTDKKDLPRLNAIPFRDFLEMHHAYSPEKREKRWNDLFMYAHQHFMKLDRKDYVRRYMGERK